MLDTSANEYVCVYLYELWASVGSSQLTQNVLACVRVA